MNPRFILILLFLFSFTKGVLAQEPVLSSGIKLFSKANTQITEIEQAEYHVFWRMENYDNPQTWEYAQKQKVHYLSEEKEYVIAEYKQYCKEIIELTIIHNTDSMIVRFNQDTLQKGYDGKKSDCQWITAFKLTIPFKKGYYEIPELYWEKFWYTNKEMVWKHLKPKKESYLLKISIIKNYHVNREKNLK